MTNKIIQQIEAEQMNKEIPAFAPGDTVIGTLPVNLVARVCARGGRYLHLSLDLPAEARGRELTADELERYGARLEAYVAKPATP